MIELEDGALKFEIEFYLKVQNLPQGGEVSFTYYILLYNWHWKLKWMSQHLFIFRVQWITNRPEMFLGLEFRIDEVECMSYESITNISQVGKYQFFQISHVFFNIRSRRILKMINNFGIRCHSLNCFTRSILKIIQHTANLTPYIIYSGPVVKCKITFVN